MKVIKKSIALALACLMLGTTACIDTSKIEFKAAAPSTNTEFNLEKYNEPGKLPMCKETQKISIGIAQNPNVGDYDTNYMTKKLEKDLNIEISFQLYPETDPGKKFEIEANSGMELPDMYYGSFATGKAAEMGASGVFADVTEYYNNSKVMYWWNKIENKEDKDFMKKASTSPDGKIYCFPYYAHSLNKITSWRFWINETWLKKLNLEMPKTTDEFYNVLKAFKDNDPNGNGKKDEIPLVGSSKTWCGAPERFLMNAYVPFNVNYQYLDGKKIKFVFDDPMFRKGLMYVHKLYAEGLLDSTTYSQDAKKLRDVLENKDAQIVGCVSMGSLSNYSEDSQRRKDMVPLPPLQGPGGSRSVCNSIKTVTDQIAITKYCKDVELAVRVADYFYNTDMAMTSRYGEKGKDWTDKVDGKEGTFQKIAGVPCKFNVLNDIQNKKSNAVWGEPGGYRDTPWTDAGQVKDPDPMAVSNVVAKSYGLYKDYLPKHDDYVPPLVMSSDEQKALSKYQVPTLRDNNIMKFISGKRPMSEYDTFLNELKGAGIDKYLEIQQKALDRWNAVK